MKKWIHKLTIAVIIWAICFQTGSTLLTIYAADGEVNDDAVTVGIDTSALSQVTEAITRTSSSNDGSSTGCQQEAVASLRVQAGTNGVLKL